MWSVENRELSYWKIVQKTTTMEGVARGERARDNILTALHICHLSRVPFGHVLIEHRCCIKHCKREGVTRKKERNTARTTQQQKNHSKKKQKYIHVQQNVWELWSDETRELSYSKIQKHKNGEGVATEREWEYTYCLPYLSPQPYSILTRPYWTQLLYKTLQEGCNKEKKEQHTTTKQKSTRTVPKTKKYNRTGENCDQIINLEFERLHLLANIVVTAPVFHLDTSELNIDAEWNTARKSANPQNNKKYHSKNKKKTNTRNVWELWSDETRVVVYLKYTTAEKAWPQRGRESTLTSNHSCHRTRIPFGQICVELRCSFKHCN